MREAALGAGGTVRVKQLGPLLASCLKALTAIYALIPKSITPAWTTSLNLRQMQTAAPSASPFKYLKGGVPGWLSLLAVGLQLRS